MDNAVKRQRTTCAGTAGEARVNYGPSPSPSWAQSLPSDGGEGEGTEITSVVQAAQLDPRYHSLYRVCHQVREHTLQQARAVQLVGAGDQPPPFGMLGLLGINPACADMQVVVGDPTASSSSAAAASTSAVTAAGAGTGAATAAVPLTAHDAINEVQTMQMPAAGFAAVLLEFLCSCCADGAAASTPIAAALQPTFIRSWLHDTVTKLEQQCAFSAHIWALRCMPAFVLLLSLQSVVDALGAQAVKEFGRVLLNSRMSQLTLHCPTFSVESAAAAWQGAESLSWEQEQEQVAAWAVGGSSDSVVTEAEVGPSTSSSRAEGPFTPKWLLAAFAEVEERCTRPQALQDHRAATAPAAAEEAATQLLFALFEAIARAAPVQQQVAALGRFSAAAGTASTAVAAAAAGPWLAGGPVEPQQLDAATSLLALLPQAAPQDGSSTARICGLLAADMAFALEQLRMREAATTAPQSLGLGSVVGTSSADLARETVATSSSSSSAAASPGELEHPQPAAAAGLASLAARMGGGNNSSSTDGPVATSWDLVPPTAPQQEKLGLGSAAAASSAELAAVTAPSAAAAAGALEKALGEVAYPWFAAAAGLGSLTACMGGRPVSSIAGSTWQPMPSSPQQGAHDMSTGLGSAAATSPAEPPSAAGPAATPAAAGPAGSSVGAGAATAERIAALVGTEDDAKRLWNISSNDIGMTDMKLDPAGRQKGWAVQTARMNGRQRPDLLNLLELVQLRSADPKKLKVSRSVDTRTGLVTVTAMVPEADRQKLEKLACCWMVALMCHGVPPSMRPPSSDAWPALDGLP